MDRVRRTESHQLPVPVVRIRVAARPLSGIGRGRPQVRGLGPMALGVLRHPIPEQPENPISPVATGLANQNEPQHVGATENMMSNGRNGTMVAVATNDDVVKSVQCPVCLNVPLPPIAQCKSGHLTCGPCRSKLAHCALCRMTFSEIRCYAMEDIINASTFECPYNEDGCEKLVKGEVFALHEHICPFRNIVCHDIQHQTCNSIAVPYTQYWEHLQEVHLMDSILTDCKVYNLIDLAIPTDDKAASQVNDICGIEIYVSGVTNTDNKRFILRGVYHKENFRFWVSYVGCPEEASNYTSTLQFRLTDCGRQVVTCKWTIPVLPFRKDVSEIEEMGLGFVESSYIKKIATRVTNGVHHIQIRCKIDQP